MAAGKTVTKSLNRTPSSESLKILHRAREAEPTWRHNPGNWPTGGRRDIADAEAVHPAHPGGDINLLFEGKLGDLPQFGSGADLEKQRPPVMKEEQLHTHSFSGSMIAYASS